MASNIEKVHKRLSLAELKNCKGFENYSDEQAEETIKSLEKISILFYELYMKQKQTVEKIKDKKLKEVVYERKPTSKKRNAA
ncbi:MAG: hypothetical protein ACYDCN_15575 [Bacteroidia bacterium]